MQIATHTDNESPQPIYAVRITVYNMCDVDTCGGFLCNFASIAFRCWVQHRTFVCVAEIIFDCVGQLHCQSRVRAQFHSAQCPSVRSVRRHHHHRHQRLHRPMWDFMSSCAVRHSSLTHSEQEGGKDRIVGVRYHHQIKSQYSIALNVRYRSADIGHMPFTHSTNNKHTNRENASLIKSRYAVGTPFFPPYMSRTLGVPAEDHHVHTTSSVHVYGLAIRCKECVCVVVSQTRAQIQSLPNIT